MDRNRFLKFPYLINYTSYAKQLPENLITRLKEESKQVGFQGQKGLGEKQT
jgi:hypothetical protein